MRPAWALGFACFLLFSAPARAEFDWLRLGLGPVPFTLLQASTGRTASTDGTIYELRTGYDHLFEDSRVLLSVEGAASRTAGISGGSVGYRAMGSVRVPLIHPKNVTIAFAPRLARQTVLLNRRAGGAGEGDYEAYGTIEGSPGLEAIIGIDDASLALGGNYFFRLYESSSIALTAFRRWEAFLRLGINVDRTSSLQVTAQLGRLRSGFAAGAERAYTADAGSLSENYARLALEWVWRL